jgi:hypothetical protein
MRNEATPDSIMKRFGDEKWSNPWFRLVIHPQNVISPDVTDSSMGGGGQQGGARAGKDRVGGAGGVRNVKDRGGGGGGGGPTIVWKEKFLKKIKNIN